MISWGCNMNHKNNIALQNIYFSFFEHGKPFFNNLTMNFMPGQINFLCGKNGVGKSTLLSILSGRCRPDQQLQGILLIDDVEYDLKKNDQISQQIGMVSQNVASMMVEGYSFYENLQFALMARYPSCQKLPELKQLPSFIEKYGISSDVPINVLSGGQRQILSILMILQRSPKILLLDEPTAALDEENAVIVMNFLHELTIQENITIVAIVHDLDLVENYAPGHYFELYQKEGTRCVRGIAI